jgi:hypothetical protein
MPRLRQAVLAARDLEGTVSLLRNRFNLGEPYRDPAVGYFGLENAVFAIGDTFLEVISPVGSEPGAETAARQLDRSGDPVCGYMAMIQVEDLAAARERARAFEGREVFEVEFDDIAEVHLHPGDMRAIVALSEPRPSDSWRWGGEGWSDRSVAGGLTGLTLGVTDPTAVADRWEGAAGGKIPGCQFTRNENSPGIVEIGLEIGGEEYAIRPESLGA